MTIGLKEKRKRINDLYNHYDKGRRLLGNSYKDQILVKLIKKEFPEQPCSLSLISKYNNAKSNPDYYKGINETTFLKTIEVIDGIIFKKINKEWDIGSESYIEKKESTFKSYFKSIRESKKGREQLLASLKGIWHGMFRAYVSIKDRSEDIDKLFNLKVNGDEILSKTDTHDYSSGNLIILNDDAFNISFVSGVRQLYLLGKFNYHWLNQRFIILAFVESLSGINCGTGIAILFKNNNGKYDEWYDVKDYDVLNAQIKSYLDLYLDSHTGVD